MFTPEFRNRLDAVVSFANLTPDVMHRVVDKFVMELEAQLTDRDVTITLTDEAREWLAVKGYDKKFGARPLARVIQEHIKKPLSEELLFGALSAGGSVNVSVGDDKKLKFEFAKLDPAQRKTKPEEDYDNDDGGDEKEKELV